MRKHAGMGLRLNQPIQALELASGHTTLDALKLVGARKNGQRTNAGTWQGVYSWSNNQDAPYGTVGRLFEHPGDEQAKQIKHDLQAIEDERRAAMEEFKRRKEEVLARMTEIPRYSYDEIERYVNEKNEVVPA